MDSKLLLNHLYKLEIELHQIEVRKDKNRLNELLHESFVEVGRYGKTVHKSDILANLSKQTISGTIWSQDYNLEVLSNDLALITYKSAMMDEEGNLSIYTFKSSLWQKSLWFMEDTFPSMDPGIEIPQEHNLNSLHQ